MVALQHHVVAFNTAKASENLIHDDATARRFGFTGGLVPGVEVYAYMTHPAARHWGRAWLESGWLSARFIKPVYDGERAEITADEAENGTLAITVRVGDRLCATGNAGMTEAPLAPIADIAAVPLPAADDRPPASFDSLVADSVLGEVSFDASPAALAAYHQAVGEDLSLYGDGGPVHPGLLLRLANAALKDNVRLGPWIHVGSQARHRALAAPGARLTGRARVARTYRHKGHGFVDLDVIVADGATRVMEARHVAIFAPRQVSQPEAAHSGA
ncbi:MAG: hypothetical protein QGF33_03460 [Alphaproteobacteria bacterium]|jgi:hypothetical protein|nr:hypothetical protein [Alphaproteobacteria bacterium]